MLDKVVHEAKLTIQFNGQSRQLYCLPNNLEELGTGYLICEGICYPDNIIGIKITRTKIKISTSSFAPAIKPEPITSEITITSKDIQEIVKELAEHSFLFNETGGAHIAGIFKPHPAIFVEDISRHCAIDKAVGAAIKRNLSLSQSILATSCRQTQSTISKAINAQIPIVISLSAVTDLAIRSARAFGITLLGFARGDRFNVYSHDWRLY